MEPFKPEILLNNLEYVEEFKELARTFLTEKCVLGLDIYRYSQYPKYEQVYIPVLFQLLYDTTTRHCIDKERFIFSTYGGEQKDFKKKLH